jgi:hypothetical protein
MIQTENDIGKNNTYGIAYFPENIFSNLVKMNP